jgi:23S rRNA-/tRNA-specific pseudouridylate synthase
MVVAKTPDAYAYLKNEFKMRKVEKVYRAYVYGHMESAAGKIVAEIMRSSTPPKKWYCRLQVPTNDPSAETCEDNNRRAAITNWKLLENLTAPQAAEPAAYVEARPRTGRTHQLRVHFASIGHPLIADHLYSSGRAPLLGFTRPALHAYEISLVLDGKKETFTAPLPPDFAAISSN